jgi:polysaccharide export outer membrane protein
MLKTLMIKNKITVISLSFITLLMASCTTTKNLDYFQDLPNTTTVNLPALPQDERVIEAGDDILISFSAKDNAAAAFFNKSTAASAIPPEGVTTSSISAASGSNYLVDVNGNIEIPQIGKLKVSGLSARQLKETLTKTVSEKLKDPIVDVYFNTFKISLIGAVRNPGTFVLPVQKPTLFDALAAAGDLAITGQRYDVQLYRDYKGQRKITRIDLRKQEVLTNPDVFLLKHNDVLIVKSRSNAFARENIGIFTSIAGLAIGLVALTFTISNNN